jgi:hypothetical protein
MDTLCEHYPDQTCSGCNAVEGKLFWTKYLNLDTCPIYNCCRNEKKLTHCGECAELPCQIYFATKDPMQSDEVHQKNIGERVAVLKGL